MIAVSDRVVGWIPSKDGGALGEFTAQIGTRSYARLAHSRDQALVDVGGDMQSMHILRCHLAILGGTVQ
jgi:hypothetical protein